MILALAAARALEPADVERWDHGPGVSWADDGIELVAGDEAAWMRRRWVARPGSHAEVAVRLRADGRAGRIAVWAFTDGAEGPDPSRPVVRTTVRPKRARSGLDVALALEVPDDARGLWVGVVIPPDVTAWVEDVTLTVDGSVVGERVPPERPPPPAVRALTGDQVQALADLGRLWAFLRWHHPALATGDVDADGAVLGVLDAVLASPDPDARRDVLLGWVEGFGVPEPSGAPAPPADARPGPPLDGFFDEARWGPPLTARLRAIHAARPPAWTRVVGSVNALGGPEMSHEHPWPGEPDAALRVLAVYRMWAALRWLAPYHDLIPGDWDRALEETLPLAFAATDRVAYARALHRLAAAFGDSHTGIQRLAAAPPMGHPCSLPVSVRFLGDALVVWDAPAGGALQRGDVLTGVDGRPVPERVAELLPETPGSNAASRMRDVARGVVAGPCGPARVALDDGRELTVERAPPAYGSHHDRPGPALQELDPAVFVLSIQQAEDAGVSALIDRLRGADALIVDARGYPGAFLVDGLAPHLVTEVTPYARFTRMDDHNPGSFVWGEEAVLEPRAPHLDLQVAVLVDEGSQSSAEYHALAFRAVPGARVIGSTTAGADGNVSTLVLPGDLKVWISGIGVYWPDRRPTQQVGIAVDTEVVPTVEGVRAGRDEVLEAAVAHLRPSLPPEAVRAIAARPPPEGAIP